VLETPELTLSSGMQWFESCVAQKFNRLRRLREVTGLYSPKVTEPVLSSLGAAGLVRW
jgi:hypothetical protein